MIYQDSISMLNLLPNAVVTYQQILSQIDGGKCYEMEAKQTTTGHAAMCSIADSQHDWFGHGAGES